MTDAVLRVPVSTIADTTVLFEAVAANSQGFVRQSYVVLVHGGSASWGFPSVWSLI